MLKLKPITKNSSGAVLVEFAISALLFFMTILTALEWSVEIYVRHATERALSAATYVYSTTRDIDLAEDIALSKTGHIVSRCFEPLEVRLFDAIDNVNLTDEANSYIPTGTPSDDAAVVARIEANCVWQRFTPFLAAINGPTMTHSMASYTKLR